MYSKLSQINFNCHKLNRYIVYFFLLNLLLSILYIYREESHSMLRKIYCDSQTKKESNYLQTLETVSHSMLRKIYRDSETKKESNYLQTLETDIAQQTSIFFIETRSNISSLNILNKRQSCAIESAALTNPNRTIYVLFSSAGPLDLSKVPLYVQAILQYPNIKLRRISMTEYMKGTPLEDWYSSGVLNTSIYILSHTSDVLRLVTLWKYGGIYLDVDTITLRSLDGLTPCLALESDDMVGSAVIAASLHGIGHQVISNALQKLKETFRGDAWAENGPILLTRTLRTVCKVSEKELAIAMITRYCEGFNMYPPSYFYPVPYYWWTEFFKNGSEADTTMAKIKDSYIVHFWNKMSSLEPVVVNSEQPYARIAKHFCPRVIQNSGKEL